MPALMSKIEDRFDVVKSWETSSSSVQSRTPLMGPAAASLIAPTMASYLAAFSRRSVRSTTDTSGVGTRNAMPVSLPLTSGMTFPTAFAAPVDDGMIFADAQRPPRQSLPPRLGPSTTSWVAVIAWTVVIKPSTMPNFSWTTLASGARQFVVHEAFDTTVSVYLYAVWFTPMTYMGTASFGGAEIMTFFAPPFRCSSAISFFVKMPVDSQM
mmetsp:Transcript_22202/g.62227  ORF Transcript_22202/g.62227 Transcript_22202/m.62227 type:complete len:211 (+) Transcript_22202:832-1464(+)